MGEDRKSAEVDAARRVSGHARAWVTGCPSTHSPRVLGLISVVVVCFGRCFFAALRSYDFIAALSHCTSGFISCFLPPFPSYTLPRFCSRERVSIELPLSSFGRLMYHPSGQPCIRPSKRAPTMPKMPRSLTGTTHNRMQRRMAKEVVLATASPPLI